MFPIENGSGKGRLTKTKQKRFSIIEILRIQFHILFQGLIGDIFIAVPNCEPIPVVSELKGKAYTEDNLNGIVSALKNVNSENVKMAINNSL